MNFANGPGVKPGHFQADHGVGHSAESMTQIYNYLRVLLQQNAIKLHPADFQSLVAYLAKHQTSQLDANLPPHKTAPPQSHSEVYSSGSSPSIPEETSSGAQTDDVNAFTHGNTTDLDTSAFHNFTPFQHDNTAQLHAATPPVGPTHAVKSPQAANTVQLRATTPQPIPTSQHRADLPPQGNVTQSHTTTPIANASQKRNFSQLENGVVITPFVPHPRPNEHTSTAGHFVQLVGHETSQLSSQSILSHQAMPVHSGDNHNHTPPSHTTTVSPTQPLDSTNTTYNTLYNELENTLRTEFTHKLRTHMYDGLHTDLSDRIRNEVAGKPSIEVAGNLYTQVYCQLYPEVYTQLSNEVLKKLPRELLMKISNEVPDDDLFMKLINDLPTKLSKELSSYASGQLYHELFGKLYADIYNQLVNPPTNHMTDSTDDNHSPCDEDGYHRQQEQEQEQEQHDQQKQEQPQQPQMAHKDGSSTDVDASPQPVSSFTITLNNGQLDIPQLGDGKKLRLRSYDVTPFALHIMLLAVLAENPDILLPLASLKECFFDHVHRLNEESFREHHVPALCNTNVIKMVIGVTCTRLNYAIASLYPPSEEEIGTDPRKRVIPELEKAHTILQEIIRDSLSVYNPMKLLLSYLRSLTTRYNTSSFATPEERKTFITDVVFRSDAWIYELHHLCSLYGLYLWDSQWMTDEEWKELASHMNIFYTKMFPHAKDDFAVIEEYNRKKIDGKQADGKKKLDDKQVDDKMFDDEKLDGEQTDDKHVDRKQADGRQADDEKPDDEKFDDKMFDDEMFDYKIFDDKTPDEEKFDSYHCRVNVYFKSILRCIASCFAFRYRPMKDPSWLNVPYGERPGLVHFDRIWVKTDVHQQTMQVFPDVLKQCVKECMNNPTKLMQSPCEDSRLRDEYLLTTSDTTTDAKNHASVRDYIMSELDDAFDDTVDGWVSEDDLQHESVDWKPQVVGYDRTDMTTRMVYLIDCIVKHPPTVDPVYQLITDVFPEEVNLSNIITVGCLPLSGDPGFTYHESSSSYSSAAVRREYGQCGE